MGSSGPGRPFDRSIDIRVLAITASHLALHGYEAMSLVVIAKEAGTTRQALYRRWPSKADLATAAIGVLAGAEPRPTTNDHYADLVNELKNFQRGVSRPDGLAMVGTMLNSATDPELVQLYRQRIVAPRRAVLNRILQRAQAAGLLDDDPDIAIAVTMLTGNWYARALAGDGPPRMWAERTAALIWRALGGEQSTTHS
jgi:AcrR family transcriptional regulator